MILQRLQSGIPLDLDALAIEFPTMADEIPRLVELVDFVHGASGQVQPLGDLDAALAIGKCPNVDGYEIQKLLARGGMGAVYLAHEKGLDRQVAIKFLASGPARSQLELDRFEREAHNASRLNHRGIVPIYRIGEYEGVPYYAMRFVDGPTLSEVFRENRSRNEAFMKTVARWGLHISSALSHAHCEGVIHRDVKPSNILIDAKDRAYITDFGLARKATDATLTRTGSLVGTLRYMSPEQARGGGKLDERSDVYSLGATLYELLSGKPVIEGEEREEILRKILLDAAAPLRKANPAVPAALSIIVHKALAKRREDRYQSAALFSADLERFLRGEDIEARPPSLRDNLRSLDRDHRLAFRSALSAFLLVSILSIVTGTQALRISQDRERISMESERALRAKEFLIGVLFYGNPKRNGYSEDFEVLLDRVAANLSSEFTDDPATEAEIRFRLGDVYSTRSRYEKADEQLRLAIELGRNPANVGPDDLAEWVLTRASLLTSRGLDREAISLLDTLDLEDKQSRSQGDIYSVMASAYVGLGEASLALEFMDKSIALLEMDQEISPMALADNLEAFASQQMDLGLLGRATETYRKCVMVLSAHLPRDAQRLLVARCYLANCLSELGLPEHDREAETLLRESVLSMHDAPTPQLTDIAWAERSWGRALYALGETEQAERLLSGSVEVLKQRLGEGDLVVQALESYSMFLIDEQRFEEARANLAEALSMCKRLGFFEDTRTKRLRAHMLRATE